MWLLLFCVLFIRDVYAQCAGAIVTSWNAPATSTLNIADFYVQTSKGNTSPNVPVKIQGYLQTVSARSSRFLMTPTATSTTFVFPTTNAQIQLVSSSASDTAAGVGCRTVLVQGLNAAGTAVTDTITMNGVTATTATGNTYSFINRLSCASVGTSLFNVGRITCAGGTWTTSNCPTIGLSDATLLPAFGYSISQSAIYKVPTGFTFSIKNIVFTSVRVPVAAATGEYQYYLFSRSTTGINTLIGTYVTLLNGVTTVTVDSNLSSNLAAGTIIWMEAEHFAINAAGRGNTFVTINGLLY